MSFVYSQSAGMLTRDGEFVGRGYSGNGQGLDNPAMQNVHGVGPLPQGKYTISMPHQDHLVGPVALSLTPDPANEMFGRGDFLIHGDNSKANHSASEGCIIMPYGVRCEIGNAVAMGENVLEVVQ